MKRISEIFLLFSQEKINYIIEELAFIDSDNIVVLIDIFNFAQKETFFGLVSFSIIGFFKNCVRIEKLNVEKESEKKGKNERNIYLVWVTSSPSVL